MTGEGRWMWAWRRYDFTKAVHYLQAGGWRLWGGVLVVGRLGFCVVWKEREEK